MESVVSGALEVLGRRTQLERRAVAAEAHDAGAAARPHLAPVALGGTLGLGDPEPVDLCNYLMHRVPRSGSGLEGTRQALIIRPRAGSARLVIFASSARRTLLRPAGTRVSA